MFLVVITALKKTYAERDEKSRLRQFIKNERHID